MQVGPFVIQALVGRGGMGAVYRARTGRGETVALKLLTRNDPTSVARFDREVRLLRELGETQGFVPIVHDGTSEQGRFLVMPFIGGGTLRDRFGRGPLPEGEVRRLGAALARALAAAHERGIVHRDVKPENVLFTGTGAPLLADLGIAKHFASSDGAKSSVALSRAGELRGTAGYLAPEQLGDARSADGRADIFALGAVLYEAVAGVPAFTGDSVVEMLGKIAEGRFEPLDGRAPGDLAAVIEACLALAPEDRPQDALTVARALEGERVRLGGRWWRARRFLAAGVLGAAALGVGAVALVSERRLGAGPADAAGSAIVAAAEERARSHDDEGVLDAVASGVEQASTLPAGERAGAGRALAALAAAAGERAFQGGAWAREERARLLEGRALALERHSPVELPRATEERHLAAQILAGAVGPADLERRQLPREALERPPLLLACTRLYDLAFAATTSETLVSGLEVLARAHLPVPPARRPAVVSLRIDETLHRLADFRRFWDRELTVNGETREKARPLFERTVLAWVRAREADPALPAFPETLAPFFEELVGAMLRMRPDLNWPVAWEARVGEHPIARYVEAREALKRGDRDAIFEAVRRAAAELAACPKGASADLVAGLFAFDIVGPMGIDEVTRQLASGSDELVEPLEQLAAARDLAPIHAAAAGFAARDGQAARAPIAAWRARQLNGVVTHTVDEDAGAREAH
jgi:hypothetical protein